MTTPLITRLEEAAEGSRELDEAIHDLLCASKFRTCIKGLSDDDGGLWMYEFPGHRASSALRVTTSLDAALALAERVLPEMNCTGFDKTPLGVEAYVSLNNVDSGHWCEIGWHKSSPALALCIAILKANHKDKP